MQAFYREAVKKYFRPYWAQRDFLIDSLPEPERKVLVDYYSTTDPTKRESMREIVGTGDQKIVSRFETQLRLARVNTRLLNPTLDAYLLYFGYVTSLRTPAAEQIYRRMLVETGKSP